MASSFNILFITLLLHLSQGKGIRGATFTFVNKCSQTIWPAILGSPVLETTGFELPKSGSRAFEAPTGWSGRFWGRTGCNFDDSGHGSCATGDCASGQLECNGAGATAATLAEFTLGSGSMDFYDVSLVDGYNLPLLVEASGGSGQCTSTGCLEDLNQRCPSELRTADGGACRSACDAFNTPEYCCKGDYGSPATCKPSAYSQAFKSACPKSYSYAYDDATSTFTCTAANYVITFCPSHPSQKSAKSDDNDDEEGGAGAGAGDGSGSGSDPESDTGATAGSGSVQEAILADGSWLADLATGDSSRRLSPTATTLQALLAAAIVVHLAAFLVHLQL